MNNNFYLSHHGILGQRWGKRNGPPYPLSSSQKSSEEKKQSKVGRYFEQNIKSGKDKPNKSSAEVITRESVNVIREAESAVRSARDISKRSKNTVGSINLSDSELKEAINRLDMEKRYKDLSSSDSTRVWDYIFDVLDVTGAIASIASSGAVIASIIYKLSHPVD